jgi:hypothetical protein
VAFELNIEASAGGIGFDFGTNGVAVNASYTSVNPVSLASGHPVNVNLYYSQDAMRVKLVDTVNSNTYVTNITTLPDFASVVGNTLGYIGFTGGDGTKTANQTITNFTFVPVIPAVVSSLRSDWTLVQCRYASDPGRDAIPSDPDAGRWL